MPCRHHASAVVCRHARVGRAAVATLDPSCLVRRRGTGGRPGRPRPRPPRRGPPVGQKPSDIVPLDIHALTSVADYLVICSGGSERQRWVASPSGIIEVLKDEDVQPFRFARVARSAHWALIDYGSVVVHVMATPGTRLLPAGED